MNTDKEQQNESRYLITVELSADETDTAIKEGVPLFLERVQSMPLEEGEDLYSGLERRFGEERSGRALADAVINYVLPKALGQIGLEPACSPVPLQERTPEAGKPYSFQARVYVLPIAELSDYETPVEVSVKRTYTTEDEIDQQLMALAVHFATEEKSELTGNEVRSVPTIDDEWVATVYPLPDINTVHDLRAQVRNRLDQMKEEEFENQKVNAAVAALSERLGDADIDEIVQIVGKDMIANIEEEIIANEGKILDVALKEQKIKREDFDRAMFERARDSVREGMTMDAVFRHENMEVTDEDLEDAIQRITSGAESPEQALEAQVSLREQGRSPELVQVARRLKAGKWIGDHARVTVEV
ncbi:MAG: trigger factor [Eggerthellaceae bacterium]|jgi:FKBP-type peptidyl-prolyl cis-trans isomerase (trigger factor)